jgi:hypothetical protein
MHQTQLNSEPNINAAPAPHPTTTSSTESPAPSIPIATADLGDLARFRIPQGFEQAATRKLLTTVPVRRPSKEVFFRTRIDKEDQMPFMVVELKEEGECYLLDTKLWSGLTNESTVSQRVLIPAITRQEVMTLWPVRLPTSDGKVNRWNQSAFDAAERAKTKWIRLKPNLALGAYEIIEAVGQFDEPNWPTETFSEIVNIAFKNKVIDSIDHPILRRLRGEN